GRTARAGRSGQSHTFVVGKEMHKIRDIERFTKSKITRKNPPSPEDVAELRTETFLDEIKKAIGEGNDLSKYESYINKLVEEDFTTFEIAAGLIKLLLTKEPVEVVQEETSSYGHDDRKGRYEGREKRGRDRHDSRDRDRGGDRERKPRFEGSRDKGYKKEKSYGDDRNKGFKKAPDASMVRLYVNVGKKLNISAGDILGAFTGETGIPGKAIGTIDIYDKFSFVDVDKKHANNIIETMNDNQIKGKRISVDLAKGKV
ncbi:MAG: DbpA RNA binding domain-containing protein, partial [Ignavibacteria bacterium]|nr:DbpA RNA binding domain-containing protein [Ignavibacteria bacterium]